MPGIKLIQLNIEGEKHLDTVVPFLLHEQADVVCLEEVTEPVFEDLKKQLGCWGSFAPLIKIITKDNRILKIGSVLLSNLQVSNSRAQVYDKKKLTLATVAIDDDSDLELGHSTLISADFEKGGQKYTVAVTHFPKNYRGHTVSDFQRKVFAKLNRVLDSFPGIILTGDTNCPRGTELFDTLAKRYTDNIPQDVKTTLDLKLHRAAPLYYVVDGLFTTPEYLVTNIRLQEGVSDHLAVIAEIVRK